jgi:hypothetical protein
MAHNLRPELHARGILSLGRADCEAIHCGRRDEHGRTGEGYRDQNLPADRPGGSWPAVRYAPDHRERAVPRAARLTMDRVFSITCAFDTISPAATRKNRDPSGGNKIRWFPEQIQARILNFGGNLPLNISVA